MVFCYQNCSDLLWEQIVLVIEKLLKFEAESREFSKFLRSLEQFVLTVGQNNFGNKIPYHRQNLANRSIGPSPWIKFVLEKHEWPANTANSKNFELVFFILVWAGKTWLWGVSFGGHKIVWNKCFGPKKNYIGNKKQVTRW